MDDPDAWTRGVRVGVPAVVLKLTSDRWQHGGLAVSRTLGRLGVGVHEATLDRGAPSSRSRYVRSHTLLPAADRPDAVLTTLTDLATRLADRPVLVPTDDVSALFVDDHPGLAESFRLPAQPAGLAHRLSNKRILHDLCLAAGVATPEARFPNSRDAMRQLATQLGFPIVIKAMDPVVLRRRPGGASVAIADNLEEALALYDRMEDPDQPNLMLQEFIPGGASSVWMFNAYFDGSGRAHAGFVGQKIRQAPPRTGATTLGVVVENHEVSQQAEHLLGSVGYRGVVDLGFRFDARDKAYKLLDVNPRIGSSFRLFATRNGLDVARALYLDLTRQPVPAGEAHPGRRWWVEDQDLATCYKMLRSGELRLGGIIPSLRGVEESAWICRDDLTPAFALSGEKLSQAITRGVGRLRGQDGEGRGTKPS